MFHNLECLEHINSLITKIRKLSNAFKQLRPIINKNQIITEYKALVKLTLTYGMNA